ncbi:MAG: hypothetical protein ACYTHJ_05425, partial [Planctomycetota bacterium]
FQRACDLNKPVVVEEFGLARDWLPHKDYHDPESPATIRDSFFELICDAVETSLAAHGYAGGINIWSWAGEAEPGDRWIGDPPHEKPGWYSVYARDHSTLDILSGFSEFAGNPR